MKKTNTLLLWTILWVAGLLFIITKNRIVQGNVSIGGIVTTSLVMDIFFVPIAIVGYFLIKFVSKAVGAGSFWEGNNALRNVLFTWLVIFLLVFLFPFFKK